MGAGKSAVGALLARRLERPFVDLDSRIEEQSGQAIRQIFEMEGQAAFRELESTCLRGLADDVPAVVALGGGVQSVPENRAWLSSHGITVWLDVPFDELVTRLGREECRARPLWGTTEEARQLYLARLADYGDSDLRIEVSSTKSVEEVAATVHQLLEDQLCGI